MNTQRNIRSEFNANLALSIAPKIVVGKHFAKPAPKREIKTAALWTKLWKKA